MRKGGGHAKGAGFERLVCVIFSRWVSRGRRSDLFWRTAMSGGRATVGRKKGINIKQAGDITAVDSEGHSFTDYWLVECKFYKNLDIASFLLKGTGKLASFWDRTVTEARKCHRMPMLICKQNGSEILIITPRDRRHDNGHCLISSWPRGVDISTLDAVVRKYKYWEDFKQ